MKKTLLVLPFLLFGLLVCNRQGIDVEHQKKVEKIIQAVASGKTLPSKFTEGIHITSQETSPHYHGLTYWGKRMLNRKMVDKVMMTADINDSLNSILFIEEYDEINNTLPDYFCEVKKGELTWAFTSRPMPYEGHPGCTMHGGIPQLIKDIEKHDTTSVIDIHNELELKDKALLKELKERNPKAVAFYEPKLLKSIDELYDILFK